VKLFLLWRRFGPYHHARLHACLELFEDQADQVVAAELARMGGEHDWRTADEDCGRTLEIFPGRTLESLRRPEVFRRLTSVLEEIDPDVIAVPSYSEAESQAAVVWARKRRRVAVMMTDSRREDAPRQVLREQAKKMIVAQFDTAVVAGKASARYLRDLGFGDDRTFKPYAVVDNDYFETAAKREREVGPTTGLPGLGGGTPYFFASGRFIERKNFAQMIIAYGRYRRELGDTSPWRLVIAGEGALGPALKDLANETAPVGDITFVGHRQANDLARYYAHAGAFVHSAIVDQWGLVVNEAMAAGLPCVVSTGAGCTEDLVVEGVTGFRFESGSDAGLVRAMREISSLDETRRRQMGRAAQDHVALWAPRRFAEALSHAALAGKATSYRNQSRLVAAALSSSQLTPAGVRAWRSVET
jgi:1,2-diacylglycerol 3-alpha-glucosyltransferase